MKLYKTPIIDENDLLKKKTLHWINLFGGENIFNTRERILKILKINSLVFNNDCGYLEEMMQLAIQNGIHKSSLLEERDHPLKSIYASSMTPYMLIEETNKHHIIANNPKFHGRRGGNVNVIPLKIGEHFSFHHLLTHCKYPHLQISKFLEFENNTFESGYMKEIIELEKKYNQKALKNLLSVYKEEAFRELSLPEIKSQTASVIQLHPYDKPPQRRWKAYQTYGIAALKGSP